MNKILMEVCCGSAEDVIEAARAGADRVELNSCLFHGGLTPSAGELIVAKQAVNIPVMTMVRPRQGGFCYTKAEYLTAMADAEQLLKLGADGLVFGFLNADGTLDKTRCKDMMSLCDGVQTVFHRAIDVADDWKQMLSDLIDLGVTRVLTSGQAPDVMYGVDVVREMIEFAQGRIQIMPGAGVNLKNVDRIVSLTGCSQIHVFRARQCIDPSTQNNRDIYYGGALYPPEDRYDLADADYLSRVRQHL